MFVSKSSKPTPWREPSTFVAEKCMKCEAGWARRSKNGTYLVVCLLDRDPVMPETVHCDRFERRDAPQT